MATLPAYLKDVVFETMYRLGISNPRRISADRLLILTFHRVLPEHLREQYPLPGLAVTPEALRWIIEQLMPFFEVYTVTDCRKRLSRGEHSRPLLSITFDDGQLDNYLYAAPVLDEIGVPGTFYLPTDFVGTDRLLWHDEVAFAWSADELPGTLDRSMLRSLGLIDPDGEVVADVAEVLTRLKQIGSAQRNDFVTQLRRCGGGAVPDWAKLMTWENAADLEHRGHEIGSHSRTHELLPQLEPADQESELAGSRDAIAANLGGDSPLSFCYPNGDYADTTISLARRLQYDNAVTTSWGINSPGDSPFSLKRCDMDMDRLRDSSGRLSMARLSVKVSGHQPGL
jgi:peptidoglycan/xylan/chitin deacetylase (PgdA/CDA1 family)